MPWYFYGPDGYLVGPRSPSVITAGMIVMSPLPYTATPPDGYLFCNGASVSKNPLDTVNYIPLYGVIGDLYGLPAATTFSLPDYRSRMPRGIVSTAGGIGYIAGSGGSATHSHTLGAHTHPVSLNHGHTMTSHDHTVPNHQHNMTDHEHGAGGGPSGLRVNQTTLAETYPNTDVNGDVMGDVPLPSDVKSPLWDHEHSGFLGGPTGFASNTSLSTTAGAGTSGASDADSLTVTNLIGNSAPGGGAVSTPVTQLPPYHTASFLIKT